MNKLKYSLLDNRRLKREGRKTIVQTDHNMIELVVEVPNTVNSIDVTGFKYIVKFDVDGNYIEKEPVVVQGDVITLSTMITEDVTNENGTVKFSITGNSTDKRFSSSVASVTVSDTITVGEFKPVEVLDIWLEDIRKTISDFKEEIGDSVGDSIDNYIIKNGLNYETLRNLPRVETIELKGSHTLLDFGLVEITADDVERMF